MTGNEFSAFLSQVSLDQDTAARVFGVSRRTVQRWLHSAQIPAPAARLAVSIARGGLPWSASFRRGWDSGVCALEPAWRNELFAGPSGEWSRSEGWRPAATVRVDAQAQARAAQVLALRAAVAGRSRGERRAALAEVLRP